MIIIEIVYLYRINNAYKYAANILVAVLSTIRELVQVIIIFMKILGFDTNNVSRRIKWNSELIVIMISLVSVLMSG